MNATKRKFNALLQGLGAKPTPQPSSADGQNNKSPSPSNRPSTPTSNQAPNDTSTPIQSMAPTGIPTTPSDIFKRRRVGVLESPSSNENTGATTISNVVLKKWTPGGIAVSPSKSPSKETKTEPARYCPSDRDELIRRLGTFQELTEWTPKPDKVNEIEWAKRGWVCRGKERVQCTLCHKELVVKINKREVDGKEVPVLVGSDIEEALVKRFVELIVDAHQDACLWRKQGCDNTLLRLPLASPPSAHASLRQRYDELCARQSFLPYLFNLRLPTDLDLQAIKSQLGPTFFTQPPPPNTNPSAPNDVALALALTGWQGLTNPRIGAVPNSASCATCLRRLGLWMFKSKEVDEATGQIIVPAPMDYLDPVREHRFFCPWRNAATQHNPGAKTADNKAAWEVLVQTIKNHAYLRMQSEKSSYRNILHRPTASVPVTPSKSVQTTDDGSPRVDEEDEDTTARDAKDKERWARLRRVKSLFNTKNGKKLQRTPSRPGTASSRPPTRQSRGGSVPPETVGEKN
ncbi:zf-C3HC-domain-containing protein [Annulohypoxylon truncatum]|uniref:zf-C3HC-domain-containing protein n=1 Tax=Annulohypoxylon truncatum TaxID=327061 RepID=UPI0020089579|nr:zf-C3HC-domain-containing protein [Annulohypoxylon truncatum]KAI1211434.1 zf-C3HC-domain-containing protein [Annulohypoxylon truncatum]